MSDRPVRRREWSLRDSGARRTGLLIVAGGALLLAAVRSETLISSAPHAACADPDDPATACRHAAVRAALLKHAGARGFSAERASEIERANALAQRAGLEEAVIPDDAVRTVSLHRSEPTRLD